MCTSADFAPIGPSALPSNATVLKGGDDECFPLHTRTSVRGRSRDTGEVNPMLPVTHGSETLGLIREESRGLLPHGDPVVSSTTCAHFPPSTRTFWPVT